MREEKIKKIVRKINLLDELSIEIVNSIGDLCIRDQENKKKNHGCDLQGRINVNKMN